MRFVDLQPDSAREGFTLHPRMTLLRGLQPFARVEIVGLVHSVALGEPVDWTGQVEVHGIRMDLAAALELVGETAPAALVLDAGTLGSPNGDEDDPLAAATERRELIESRIEDLATELGRVGEQRDELQAQIAATTPRIDDDAARRLDRADGKLLRAARDADRPDPWSGMGEVEDRVAALESLSTELDDAVDALPAGDRAAIAAAAATARASLVTGEVQVPRAAALVELWGSLHQRLTGLESRIEAGGRDTETLAALLDDGRERVRRAEEAATPRPVTDEESTRLAELHDRVLELEGKASRGVRRGSARDRLREAQHALHEALELLGYPSWAAYRMGNGMVAVSAEAVREHEEALAALATAEREWADLMTRLERDPELQEVLAAIDRVHGEAVELIGSDPLEGADDRGALVAALDEVVVEAAEVAVDADDALDHLRHVLDESGAVGHREVISPAGVVALAVSWLEGLDAADAAAVRVLRDRERAAEELAALRSRGDGPRVDGLGAARDEVRILEAEVAASREALLEVAAMRLDLHMIAVSSLRLAQAHDELLEKLEAARVLEEESARRAPEGDRSRRTESLPARVPRGLGGPVPVVVAMGDTDPAVLDRLLDLPGDVQVLVVGDPPGLAEWADAAGTDVVGVVEAGALV